MRIAVTYEDGQVFQHFGHTENFKIYQVEGGRVRDSAILETGGTGHGALAGLLKENGVEVLICGGLGDGAKKALAQADIKLYGGASGDADRAVEDLLAGRLRYNPDVSCSHHGDHHHEEGHDCGGHGEHHHHE